MIIAIDGPSGTGKSTVARGIAERLHYLYFDTGAMYRCFAWKVFQQHVVPTDEKALQQLLDHFQFDIRTDRRGNKQYFVNGVEVTSHIRQSEISTLASQISIYPFVRHALVQIQRKFGHQMNVVFEGRDMGTVVFPDAKLKFFLTARPEVRAERRYRELLSKFPDLARTTSQEQILKELQERDHKDTTRTVSPLRQADDAILIDTSDISAEQVIDQIVAFHALLAKERKYAPMRWPYWLVYWTVRMILKIFYRLHIDGLSHFRPGAGIIAANHASFLDPPIISVSCPEEVYFLAREPLFRVPLLGRLIRILNSYPVARDASDVQTFRTLLHILGQGKKVIIFPEGSRSWDGRLQPFERGMAFLVSKARCGILPVYVDGAFRVWKRGKKFPRPFGRIRCVFGSPIEWDEFDGLEKKEALQQITKRVEESIRALEQWVASGAKGTPP